MRGFRDALLSATFARHVVVSVLAAVAVIVGLLAMHTLNLHNDDTGAIVATSVASEHHLAADQQVAAHADCDGPCTGGMPMHDAMTMTMACILALMLLVLVVGPPLMLRIAGPPRGLAFMSTLLHTVVEPRPPSLLVLSISRT